MLYLPTIISIVEVLIVTVPVLFTVAFVTVAERKTMASMQRRVGPNIVGQLKLNLTFKRLYHSSSYDKMIETLYIDRKAPIKPFKENLVCVCEHLLSTTTVSAFFNNIKGKGGIYMFTLKSNPNIYYIGRAKNFQKRFKTHLNIKLNDRFHTFADTIGWDKFEYSIVEICSLNIQQERENYFLQKYLPLLNTIFRSNLNDTQTSDYLYKRLKSTQFESNYKDKYKGIFIYVYKPVNGQLTTSYKSFSSINQLSSYLNVARNTLSLYLNTYVPFRGNLFLTNKIESLELVEKRINDATQGLNLDRNLCKKVWMYFINSDGTIVKTTYKSKSAVAKLLNVQHKTITDHIDKWIKEGINGNYLFSEQLDKLKLRKLMETYTIKKYNCRKVWVYNALTLELLTHFFCSMQKAADYLKVDYRSILNHLDTDKATIKGGKLVLLFSDKLTQEKKDLLLNYVQKASHEPVAIWVYKNVEDKLTLLNNKKTNYSSKLEASILLKISSKTIDKYLNIGKEYKGLYFYSVAI